MSTVTSTTDHNASSSSLVIRIEYSDLVDFDQDIPNDNDIHNNNNNMITKINNNNPKHTKLLQDIGIAFGNGPESLGLLVVVNIPKVDEYRSTLLPLGAKLANLSSDVLKSCTNPESCFSVGWSHGQEQLVATGGKKDFSKGSFYMNPIVDDIYQAIQNRRRLAAKNSSSSSNPLYHIEDSMTNDELHQLQENNPAYFAPNVFPSSSALPNFRQSCKQMGQCMVHVGTLLAKVCHVYMMQQIILIAANNNNNEVNNIRPVTLHEIIKTSYNCKARLLHYFADAQHPETTTTTNNNNNDNDDKENNNNISYWCAWHKDHSALTALLPSMYLPAVVNDDSEKNNKEQDNNNDHEKKIIRDDNNDGGGLMIQTRNGSRIAVQLPQNQNALGFQMGETFQILSGGIFQATPHAVIRSPTKTKTTREAFAVFMGPEYGFPMDIIIPRQGWTSSSMIHDCDNNNNNASTDEVLVETSRPLSLRWKPGMNYGQFQQATLDAFYK